MIYSCWDIGTVKSEIQSKTFIGLGMGKKKEYNFYIFMYILHIYGLPWEKEDSSSSSNVYFFKKRNDI